MSEVSYLSNHKLTIALVILSAIVSAFWSSSRIRKDNQLPRPVMEAIKQDPHLTLYSIDSDHYNDPPKNSSLFHGYPILGQCLVNTPSLREQLAAFIDEQVIGQRRDNSPLNCNLQPRHGLRATAGTNTFDLVICFECGNIDLYQNNSAVLGRFSMRYIESSGIFNSTLTNAHVPLPKQPGDSSLSPGNP